MIRFEPLEGGVYKVSHEVESRGVVLFRRGEIVKVESVDPDPSMPECRFVVQCEKWHRQVRLRATDLECPHEYEYLPDGTSRCLTCGKNITSLGTELPFLAEECSQCNSRLEPGELVCGTCGLTTPFAVRQSIIEKEAKASKNRPVKEYHPGHSGYGSDVDLGLDIITGFFDIFGH